MSSVKLDMRGKPCPAPVVETKKALESVDEGIITVIVDSEVSKNNVTRFVAKSGYSADVSEENGVYTITVTKGFTCEVNYENNDDKRDLYYVLYVKNSEMGHGDVELGSVLMKAFFKTLVDSEKKPKTIIFVNKGVFLVTEGSNVLEELKVLNEKFNTEILACGTCLDFYNIKDQLKIGVVSNMFDIQDKLIKAKKIVTP
jgi:selenium metabolism protein YedF